MNKKLIGAVLGALAVGGAAGSAISAPKSSTYIKQVCVQKMRLKPNAPVEWAFQAVGQRNFEELKRGVPLEVHGPIDEETVKKLFSIAEKAAAAEKVP